MNGNNLQSLKPKLYWDVNNYKSKAYWDYENS